MSRFLGTAIIAAAVLAVAPFASAQKESAGKGSGKRTSGRVGVNATNTSANSTGSNSAARRRGRDVPPMALTPSRKAAALEFARQHHPELADLLRGLEKRNRAAYHRAMRQLYQTSERLARTKERFSPERFELELEAWKLDSRIRLLAARVAVSKKTDSKLEAELRQALLERIDIRVRKMQKEKVRLRQRLANLDSTINSIDADREKAADQYLARIKRGLGIKNRRPRGKMRAGKRKAAQRKRRAATNESKQKQKETRSKP